MDYYIGNGASSPHAGLDIGPSPAECAPWVGPIDVLMIGPLTRQEATPWHIPNIKTTVQNTQTATAWQPAHASRKWIWQDLGMSNECAIKF
jgi:hypothetical protein